jgi:hypothetical protein
MTCFKIYTMFKQRDHTELYRICVYRIFFRCCRKSSYVPLKHNKQQVEKRQRRCCTSLFNNELNDCNMWYKLYVYIRTDSPIHGGNPDLIIKADRIRIRTTYPYGVFSFYS